MTPLADRACFAAFLDLRDRAAVVVGGGERVDGPIGRKALEGAHEEARAMLESELGEGPAKGRG